MRWSTLGAVCGAMVAAGSAVASPVIQLDVNAIKIQVQNSAGQNSAFGGLSHTGSVNFSLDAANTILAGVFIQNVAGGPFSNAGFSGSISNFVGTINLNNGLVTGGSLAVFVNGNTDSYTCNIVPNIGHVSTYVGGGFKIEGLTFQGMFSDSQFGNVNVGPWFSSQGGGGLPGSFIQFNFDPNASGGGFADLDIFVDTPTLVPVPPAAWTGMATLAGLGTVTAVRRRRR
jgi:hypothetical protein